jgi:hypothetical protein
MISLRFLYPERRLLVNLKPVIPEYTHRARVTLGINNPER